MPNTYAAHATAAANLLTSRWFTAQTPYDWVPDDYWKTPAIAAELVRTMALNGTTSYLGICDNTRDAGQDWLTTSTYLDDATVWGMFHVLAYDWLHSIGSDHAQAFHDDGMTVYDNLTQQWTDACGGGLFWMRDPTSAGNFKASNATLGLAQIAIGFYQVSGRSGQREWAQRAWQWVASRLVDAGLVWGGLTTSCAVDKRNIPVLGLQGNPLVPLWDLYAATGSEAYLVAAEEIVEATLTNFTWPGTTIIRTPFDGEWSGQDSQWRENHIGDAVFKGGFMGPLGVLARNLATVKGHERAAQRYAGVIRANADAVIQNFPRGIFDMDWHTPKPQYEGVGSTQVDAVLQFSGLSALNAAAGLEAAGVLAGRGA